MPLVTYVGGLIKCCFMWPINFFDLIRAELGCVNNSFICFADDGTEKTETTNRSTPPCPSHALPVKPGTATVTGWAYRCNL